MQEREGLFSKQYSEITELLSFGRKIAISSSLGEFLEWDQQTYMPEKGNEARGEFLAYITAQRHEIVTSKIFRNAVDVAESLQARETLNVYDKALIKKCRREIKRNVSVPENLVTSISLAKSRGFECWGKARQESNFGLLRDALAEIVDLKTEEAACVGFTGDPYNFFLDDFEFGLTVKEVEAVFGPLKNIVLDVLSKVRDADIRFNTDILGICLPKDKLLAFSREILNAMGFDFTCGRLDISAHPFTVRLHPTDVRITTRFRDGEFTESIQSSMHEGGHGLFELGVNPQLALTPVGCVQSMGMHESQSRFWEMGVGTSLAFWQHWYPKLVQYFPDSGFESMSCEDFVKVLTAVEPNLIRTSSHEVPYNLHIILRYEIERLLLSGKITVDELPALWNAKVKEYMGLDVPDDVQGILQDPHWAVGLFGYFPTYSLGNMTMAQLLFHIKTEFSDYNERLSNGEMGFILKWLRTNVHQYADTFSLNEMLVRTTGESLNPEYLKNYFHDKYGPMYGF